MNRHNPCSERENQETSTPLGNLDDALSAYAELVRRWAPRLDLIAPGDLDRLEERHLADSLRAALLIEAAPEGPCIDVGSGAGLPGVPLALAAPSRLWRLLEPRSKRAAFLDEVVRELGLPNVQVLARTSQEAAGDPALAGSHAVATARALAPPQEAFGLLEPLVAPGGLRIVWIGENARVPRDAEERDKGLAIMRVV